MDFGEHLRNLDDRTFNLKTQQDAQALIDEYNAPTYIDRANETSGSFIRALGKDLLALTTAPMRIRTFKLQRQIGLSAFQALRHSSPSEGLVTAALIVPDREHN